MSRALLDTNIVSYWYAGEKRFASPLRGLLRELSREKSRLYISSVTVQEIGCWAISHGAWRAVERFMSASRLNSLPFCDRCALEAAKIQAKWGPEVVKKSEIEESRAQWHHDAALVGTAVHHELDMVVTTDAGLAGRYASAFDEIRLLRPDGAAPSGV